MNTAISYKNKSSQGISIENSYQAAAILRMKWKKIKRQEQTYVLFLNRKDEPITFERINIGDHQETLIDFKETMRIAMKCKANKIIVAHNHTEDNFNPSPADLEVAKKLNELCKVVNLPLMDFLIVTYNGRHSFRDCGLLEN